jgi:REP element-mobilizing transposase RayT
MKPHQYPKSEADKIPTLDYREHPANLDILLPVRRPWRRLGDVDYRDPDCTCLLTICTQDRARVFAEPRFAQKAKDVLLNQCIRVYYRLFAYVIMPDHVHIVLQPGHSGWSAGKIVGRWKSYVTHCLKEMGVKGSSWQRDFDDRVLRLDERGSEGLMKMIAYVLENPVRKGLAKTWREYPFCGCFVDLDKL